MASVFDGILDGFKPEPAYTVSEWADNYRILPQKGSSEPGRYRTARTPYIKEIVDNLYVLSSVMETCVMKGTQLGMTEAGNNWFGYTVDASPGPMLMIFPTDALAENHSKQKLGPTIEETPRLLQKVKNNTMTKDFAGGILFMCGANSPANFRSKSIRYLFLDDMDGYPAQVGGEGDPAELARKRTDNFSVRKKIFEVSTPTVKGISRIEASFNESDQRYYYVHCPFCGEKQRLEWGGRGQKKGVKFKRDKNGEVIAAWYECKFCHEGIDESHKTKMLEQGEWIPTYPHRKKRGYHLNSLYSPLGWVSWKQIAEEFLKAKDSPERLKTWTNTRMADVWDEEGSQPDWVVLKNRADQYRMGTVPDAGVVLAAGVDVQENRLVVIVRAWGPGEESWGVLFTEIYGNPNRVRVWTELDMLLNRPFMHESGSPLYIDTMAVDSGYLSHAVYNFCRHRPLKTIATKGVGVAGKPVFNRPSKVDVTWQGETIKDGCQLWTVGVDAGKTQLYSRLSMRKPGPGYYHFPVDYDDEYYLQLTAEKRITEYKNGFPHLIWVKLRERNDVLDCEVYAYAAALRAGMAYCDFDAVRASKLQPAPVAEKPARNRTKPKPKRW